MGWRGWGVKRLVNFLMSSQSVGTNMFCGIFVCDSFSRCLECLLVIRFIFNAVLRSRLCNHGFQDCDLFVFGQQFRGELFYRSALFV